MNKTAKCQIGCLTQGFNSDSTGTAFASKMEADNTSSVADSSETEMLTDHMHTFSLVIYCLITVVGTVGNALVIYVTGYKMKKTVNSVWFLNLALADFLFTSFLVFATVSLYNNRLWPFGNVMCKLYTFVSVINMFASVFFLTSISLDRCLSIWVVVWAQNRRTVRKAQIISAVIWLAAGICSVPYATFRSTIEFENNTYCTYPVNSIGLVSALDDFRFIMGFLIPFLVIFSSYVAIGIRARRLQRTRNNRSQRIIFSIIFAFFICWLPFHVMVFIGQNDQDDPDLQKAVVIGGTLTVGLAFMNSCLNPILYVFMCEDFQKQLKKSICAVLESALAEERASFASSRSTSVRVFQKSISATAFEEQDTDTKIYTQNLDLNRPK